MPLQKCNLCGKGAVPRVRVAQRALERIQTLRQRQQFCDAWIFLRERVGNGSDTYGRGSASLLQHGKSKNQQRDEECEFGFRKPDNRLTALYSAPSTWAAWCSHVSSPCCGMARVGPTYGVDLGVDAFGAADAGVIAMVALLEAS